MVGISAAIFMASTTVATAVSQSEAQAAQGEFQRSQSELNARISDYNAQEANERGRADAATSYRKTTATAGAQKVALAAQGLDVSSGSAAETIEQTRAIGAVEEMNIRTNAWREAWGYRAQSINDRMEGEVASIAGRGASRNTLIAGGMSAVASGISAYNTAGGRGNSSSRSSGGGNSGSYGNQPRISSRWD